MFELFLAHLCEIKHLIDSRVYGQLERQLCRCSCGSFYLRRAVFLMTAINAGFTFAGLEPLGSSSTELLGVWLVGASALSADKVEERREEHHLPQIIKVRSD